METDVTVESGWAYSSRERVQEIAPEVDANKRSHKYQRSAQSFIMAGFVGPVFEPVVGPGAGAADNLGEGWAYIRRGVPPTRDEERDYRGLTKKIRNVETKEGYQLEACFWADGCFPVRREELRRKEVLDGLREMNSLDERVQK